jgi:hypothetical protein
VQGATFVARAFRHVRHQIYASGFGRWSLT